MDAFDVRYHCLDMARQLMQNTHRDTPIFDDTAYLSSYFDLAIRLYSFMENKTTDDMENNKRIYHIDVGTMPPAKINEHIERIKNEIHQRRQPDTFQKPEFDIKSIGYSISIDNWSLRNEDQRKGSILVELEQHNITMDEITKITITDEDKLVIWYSRPLPPTLLANEIIKYVKNPKI